MLVVHAESQLQSWNLEMLTELLALRHCRECMWKMAVERCSQRVVAKMWINRMLGSWMGSWLNKNLVECGSDCGLDCDMSVNPIAKLGDCEFEWLRIWVIANLGDCEIVDCEIRRLWDSSIVNSTTEYSSDFRSQLRSWGRLRLRLWRRLWMWLRSRVWMWSRKECLGM